MIPQYIRGSIAPVFTAFHEDLTIDETGQRRLLDYLLDQGGVSAYFLRSGMGQMYTFSVEEVRLMARLGCEHLRGKAAALIGCAGEWDRNRERRPDRDTYIRQCIDLGQYALDQGADGVVYTIPEALAPQNGETHVDIILSFFERICAAVSGPILIYQPPGTQAEYCVTPGLIKQLAALPGIHGIKLSTSDGEYVCDIGGALDGTELALICGCETVFYAALLAGAKAVIGQGATLNPKVLNAIQDRMEAGDLPGAMRAQHKTNLLCRSVRNPVAFFKRYVTEKGYPVKPYGRMLENNPYVSNPAPLSDEEYAQFRDSFETELAAF